ncbi:MAG: hypothetical protein GC168_12100 [Candidatus Hydrogenedens sp.]|nr:hypothetical protein [Candidatus Hydrogenedens sp.]
MVTKLARKIAVAVVGVVLIIAGIIMLFVPGQGILTILLGLGVLATEFPWAHRMLRRFRIAAKRAWRRAKAWYHSRA